VGDTVIIAHKRLTCQIWAAADLNVYSYRFDIIPASIPNIFAASHVQEIAFVFFNLQGVGYNPINLSPWNGTEPPFEGKGGDYIEAAQLMSSSWVSFVYDQNPNSFRIDGGGDSNLSAPIWPLYETGGLNGTNFVFEPEYQTHLEADNFRYSAINLLNSAVTSSKRR
jgi:acetylcholinesterase